MTDSTFFDRLLSGATKRETGPLPTEVPMAPMPQVSMTPSPKVPPKPQLSTIEDAYGKAKGLVVAMEAKKLHWEGERDKAIEELRQAEVVLAGGRQLLETISKGLQDQKAINQIEAGMEQELAGLDLSNNPA